MQPTRRSVVAGAAVTPFVRPARAAENRYDVAVIGAGVMGAWTAETLRRRGKRVLLMDAWGPGQARSSSGGESRMIRAGYGADTLYSTMARDSLPAWKALSDQAGLPLFHNTGVLMFFDAPSDYARASEATLPGLGVEIERLEPEALKRRYPQIDWSGVVFGLYEPGFGALMARRAVLSLVNAFVERGGSYARAAAAKPEDNQVHTLDGDTVQADSFVFACGPWLAGLFPDLVAPRLFTTRQEIFYFRPPAGSTAFRPEAMPGWADSVDGDFYYGFPDLEARGFKVANDAHGPRVDFDRNDRRVSDASVERIRAYLARRFPALADAPLSEARVCQYANSANGDLLIDRHPDAQNWVLVGMGSGHGFKHGPEIGRRAADLVTGERVPEERFRLAQKGKEQDRSVH